MVNNVETIAAVVPIINEGGDEYAKLVLVNQPVLN